MNSCIFLCLGLCLIILGIFGYLMSVKFAEQHAKMTAMCDLVQNLAQDLQMLKIQHTMANISERTVTNNTVSKVSTSGFKKIVVDDSETPLLFDITRQSHDAECDAGASDNDSDDSYGSDSDTDESVDIDEDPRELIYEHDINQKFDMKQDDNIRTIQYPSSTPEICAPEWSEFHTPTVVLSQDTNMFIEIDMSHPKVEEVIVPSNEEFVIELSPDTTKHIVVDLDDSVTDVSDYTKLDVAHLRKLVSIKHLAPNPSKLKKKELLELLQA